MNRSECLVELRSAITKLNLADYESFVDTILTTRCPSNDTLCEDKRLVVIDIVGTIGNHLSQDLLLRHVVNKPIPNEEELQKLFLHCVSVKNPTNVSSGTKT